MQTTPTTISEALATWTALDGQLEGTDDETFNHLANEQARIKRAAVRLPIRTVRDVFPLLARTTDKGERVGRGRLRLVRLPDAVKAGFDNG